MTTVTVTFGILQHCYEMPWVVIRNGKMDTLLGRKFRKLTLSTEAVHLEYNSKIYNTTLVKH